MSKPLMPVGELITQSFRDFARDWNKNLSISAWFLFAPALVLAGTLLGRQMPNAERMIVNVFNLFGVIVTLWATLRLMRVVLWRDQGKKVPQDEAKTVWPLFWPFIWVGFLEFLAVMGGLVVFFFPGVWIAILLTASRYFMVEDGLRGTQALAASAALVKGRWWATFWRVVIPGFIFLLVFMVAFSLLSTIMGAIAGPAKMQIVLQTTDGSNPVASAFQYLLQGIIQVIFMPLFITWQVKLFHALKESR